MSDRRMVIGPLFSSQEKTAVRCPYHIEATASLILDHKTATFHCLGCGSEGTFKDEGVGVYMVDRSDS